MRELKELLECIDRKLWTLCPGKPMCQDMGCRWCLAIERAKEAVTPPKISCPACNSERNTGIPVATMYHEC